jgi:hypothetical protein
MAEDGYVGPYNGSKSREVLLTAAAWAAMKSGGDVVEGSVATAVNPVPAPDASPQKEEKASLADEILQEILGEADAEEAKVAAKPLKPLPKASSRTVSLSASVSPALAEPEEELEDEELEEEEYEEEEEVDVENELEDYMTEEEVEASGADEEFEDDEEYEEEDDDEELEDDEEYEYVDEDYDEDEYEDVE